MKKSILHFISAFLLIANCLLPTFSFAQYTKLLDFNGTNGALPNGSLIFDGTFLYGMTETGGTGVNSEGIIFKIKPDGTGYSKLLNFDSINGRNPPGSFIYDSTFLYGMTLQGGSYDLGTVFKIRTDGTGYSKLHDFDTVTGSNPEGSLISDGTFLYGMTRRGGITNQGTIFKIKLDGTSYTKILDFGGAIAGVYPYGDLVSDGTFLYGMTYQGWDGTNNCGTIFKIKPDGTGYSLLSFFNGSNGCQPFGSLIYDGTFLYGMTVAGGTPVNNLGGNIFKIKPDGTGFVTLLNFIGTSGGAPYGSLFYDGSDYLYGMTGQGGSPGAGVLFKIKTDGTNYDTLINFHGSNGAYPRRNNLISDGTFLYGMTESGGGASSNGVIFKYCITPITFTQSPRICMGDSLIIGSHTYTESGTYIDTLRAFNSCDSIVTSNITVFHANISQTMILCSGQSITVGLHTYTSSGTYIDVFTGSKYNGCDSTVKTQLTVLPTNSITCTGNCLARYSTMFDTLQNTFTLTVDSTTTTFANNYLWDFGDGNTSTLATPTHVYTTDTVYNVCLKIKTASNDSCSYCHMIGKDYLGNIYRTSGFTLNVINSNLTGVSSTSSNENSFIIFPNPTSGETEIMFYRSVNNITIKVFNVTGQKIIEKINVSGNRFNIDISDQTAGVYFIEIISADNVQRVKLIKQ